MSLATPEASRAHLPVETHHTVRVMDRVDLEAVVAWHRQAFPAGFYSQLGPAFMDRWFRFHLDSAASVSLVACDAAGAVVGYLLGTLDDAEYGTRALADDARLLGRGAAALTVRPGLWAEFGRRRARPYSGRVMRRLKRGSTPRRDGAGDGELVYICVEPEHRRQGAGAALLEAFTGEAMRSGTRRLHLVTEEDNLGAQRFYVRHGWQVMYGTSHALDGRTLVRMQRVLAEEAACVD